MVWYVLHAVCVRACMHVQAQAAAVHALVRGQVALDLLSEQRMDGEWTHEVTRNRWAGRGRAGRRVHRTQH